MVSQAALRAIAFEVFAWIALSVGFSATRSALFSQELIEEALQVHFDYVEFAGRDRHIRWEVIDYNLITVSLSSKLLQVRRGFALRKSNVVRFDHLTVRI
jgi:hypothetical protein